MSHYIKDENILWPTSAVNLKNGLPLGTYSIGVSPQRGYFLQEVDDFKITGKIYGNSTQHADRFLDTFESRPAATGVLLTGEKGSGKTLLAKMMSQKAAERGISTLVINSPLCGEPFNLLIQSINEPCVVIFDEFEKIYDDEHQQRLLTLLDGVSRTKKLFLITTNDRYKINTYMQNRPGRIFYAVEFGGLDAEFVKEYCDDNLDNKTYIPTICRLVTMFESFNFDMLKALVEEMNRYKESPHDSLKLLNARPLYATRITHEIRAFVNDVELPTELIYPHEVNQHPVAFPQISVTLMQLPLGSNNDATLVQHVAVAYGGADKQAAMTDQRKKISAVSMVDADDDCDTAVGEGDEVQEMPTMNRQFNLLPENLVDISSDGVYTYVASESVRFVFSRKRIKPYNYLEHL